MKLTNYDRTRLGAANLKAFGLHLDLLLEDSEAVKAVPDDAIVVYEGTGDSWVDAKNRQLAEQALEIRDRVHFVRL